MINILQIITKRSQMLLFEEIMVQKEQLVLQEVNERVQNNHKLLNMNDVEIVEVWQDNMQEEIVKISYLSEKYNIIAFDTEFPGTVKFLQKISEDEDDYNMVKENVNSLKLIQIGFCLCNDKGEVPEKGLIWQFNFKFDLAQEAYHPDAIAMLKECGIDFDRLAKDGCDHLQFAEFILSSGIVLNDEIKWICFHGSYDFAYFLKLMINQELSDQNQDFLQLMQTYFPQFHDIKFLINDIESIRNMGLGNLASELKVSNKGPQHQAGGDSLTTLLVYLKLLENHLKNTLQLDMSLNVIYGIGKGYKKKDFLKQQNNAIQEMDQMQDYNYINMQNQYNMLNMMWPQMNGYYMPQNQMQMYINQNEYVPQTQSKKKKK